MNLKKEITSLETYFDAFRKNIIGINQTFNTPYGEKKVIYTDWTASGRLYAPIEQKLAHQLGPFIANTHTETSSTGAVMTMAYHEARNIIKKHVNANINDVLITEGSGMTGVVNKFQRILGLKIADQLKPHTQVPEHLKPIVFVSHMEHHSNQTSWLETIADVVVVPPNNKGLICPNNFKKTIAQHQNRATKIVSITAASNVTGIKTPYHEIAKIAHQHNGLCFVDFACSAPYVNINMHPEKDGSHLDAIFFSPHKFLGGPASSGILIFNQELYKNEVPDNPGGGTVTYTNPWGEHSFINDIEAREDGGTPAFMQTIKAAFAIQLKEKMGVENIENRENEINKVLFNTLLNLEGVNVLADTILDRLSIFSFYFENYHFNLVVKILNDKFGIQTRGGCSCAGTYGHFLLHVDKELSHTIAKEVVEGCDLHKPGWVRLSVHPTISNSELQYICDSLKALAQNIEQWSKDYIYLADKNDYIHKSLPEFDQKMVKKWFNN